MTHQATTHPRLKARAGGRSVLVSATVVISCPTPARVAALKRALAARGRLAVSNSWPVERALAAGREAHTAVVILDRFPSNLELRAIAEITAARRELSVLVLGPLQPNTEMLIALACGAAGYLPSGSAPTAVAHAVDSLLAGETVVPRAVPLPLVQDLRWRGRGIAVTSFSGQAAELTNREWKIYVLLRQARSTAEIAARLEVSSDTIRTHILALVRKLGVHDRGALTAPADHC